jgi:post-segregation antitoxin (ccd killing protein)
MKRINAKGEVVQQTSIYTRENAYLLAKEASIPMSEAAEQGVITALRARGVEV